MSTVAAISSVHPRLLGSLGELRQLAGQRPQAYRRMAEVARRRQGNDFPQAVSMALVSAIEGDAELARRAVEMTRSYIEGPIKVGHVAWGNDMALCAVVFDLCREYWSANYAKQFFDYACETVRQNIGEEMHVFHNSYHGTRAFGIGLTSLAMYHEDERAAGMWAEMDHDFRTRAIPALQVAGDGGSWGEGYYIHYFIVELLMFCETARRVAGVDYYAMAPKFFKNRAIANMFEMYPGLRENGVYEPVPFQDYGTRSYKPHRDRATVARRILVNYYRNDPAHQAVHAFNQRLPQTFEQQYAYLDFLYNDPTVAEGDLKSFTRSHYCPGPGYVFARSSWEDDATYFYFKCGPRFTSHQHLDNGQFLIFKREELAGDGGHFSDWSGRHDPNYYTRSIAHSTILVHDPSEQFAGIRQHDPQAVVGNDGGQAFPWRHIHVNGGMADMEQWEANRELLETGKIVAFEDKGDYLYVAGDASRSYARSKLEYFTRQIVFLRPGTFVIFDRVKSTRPEFKKSWLLQALQVPTGQAPNLVVTHGSGRLFIQTLLPAQAKIELHHGPTLYQYGGQDYTPAHTTGVAPRCRIEISPAKASAVDYFLHVLTATEANVDSVPQAKLIEADGTVGVELPSARIGFDTAQVHATIQRR